MPEIVPRTSLYAIEPIGFGTAGVERMGSYLARLALAHCVTPRHLLELHFGFGGYKHLYPVLSGFGLSTAAVVERVEALTGNANLSSLTLLAWKGAVSRNALLRKTRAWCPRCYDDQRNRGEPAHDKLLWAVQAVRVCARHRCDLIDSCRECNYRTREQDALSFPGHCPSCGTWLGSARQRSRTSTRRSRFEWQWEVWKATAVRELLAATTSLKAYPTKADVQDALRRLRHQSGCTARTFREAVGISQRQYYYWLEGRCCIALDPLLRIAWATGTRPLGLLCGEFESETLRRAPEAWKFPCDRPHSRAGFEEKWERLERAARASLHRRPPVTIAQLARELHVSAGYLRKVLPKDLKRELVARYTAFKVSDRRQHMAVCSKEIRRIFEELLAIGVYPATKLVMRLLDERPIPSCRARHRQSFICELQAEYLNSSLLTK